MIGKAALAAALLIGGCTEAQTIRVSEDTAVTIHERCYEDAAMIWDGDGHHLCITIEEFCTGECDARLREIVVEELEGQ